MNNPIKMTQEQLNILAEVRSELITLFNNNRNNESKVTFELVMKVDSLVDKLNESRLTKV